GADLLAVDVEVDVVMHLPGRVPQEASQPLVAALEGVQQLLHVGGVHLQAGRTCRREPERRRDVDIHCHGSASLQLPQRSAASSGTLRYRSPVSQRTVTT